MHAAEALRPPTFLSYFVKGSLAACRNNLFALVGTVMSAIKGLQLFWSHVPPSGRVSEYHKRGISIEAIASPVEDIRQAREDTMQSDGNVDIEEQITPAVDENEDTMLNANTLSHRIRPTAEEEGISVPFTPATPVNRIEGGTVSFFRNGSHDRQSL
eukprot:scaffold1605_cov141-Cylindrotheca_fusiformis.AAC.13